MLIATYEDPHYPTPYPVGIAVAQWKEDSELGTYVLYPIKADANNYVEVEIAFGTENLGIIKPPLNEWQPLGDKYADEAVGYPSDDETVQDLYDVWDDGAAKHPEAARRLYEKYKPLIDTYAKDAIQFMNKHAAEEYDQKVKEAKVNGWDIALIEKSEPLPFPYQDKSV